ncbi:ABC transporter permease [Scleromatobacter humisilvae]|uniref:ABC transporter permease n=1 Tax=Scleromatobacter humisilvae TaxID=2897159 RepID=A0A9X2C0G6_9BURK|nr:FtsX-like permease family protein [Scleromatobacter humisilvae]MCK9684739.1 ABC transporter permease [Scleromatobacter humisilvae]
MTIPSTTTNEPRRPQASVWRLAGRQVWRDFIAGELRLLLWAVVLAVGALTAVGFFADRMRSGLVRDAAQLLGGDTVVLGDKPLASAFMQEALRRGFVVGQAANFPSMARAGAAQGGAARLAAVKAVDAAYPLRGTIDVRFGETAPVQSLKQAPAAGTVWIDPALANALALKVGDGLELGDATLRIAALIAIEPDRGTGFSALAPRVMLNVADLPATGLVQPSSRITWRLAVGAPNGDDKAAGAYADWAKAKIKTDGLRGMHVENLTTGRPEMTQTVDRAQQFLSLVALLTALLSAVAVAVAARDFAQRHLDDCAMLRVLGETQNRIAAVHAIEFFGLGLVASVVGLGLGFVLHLGFVALLTAWLPNGLPWPGPMPALLGVGVGLTLLLGFGLPPVLQLARVPPLRVLRRDVGTPKVASLGVLAGAFLGFAALMMVAARDVKLALISVGGFAGAALLFALVGWLAVLALRRFVPETRAPRWLVLATRAIAARPAFAVLQVSSMAIGLMALWVLILLRTDLIDSWRAATPPDAPNRFVINIQPDQAQAYRDMLKAAGVHDDDWFPMIRGRLISINDEPIAKRYKPESDASNMIQRELNLSHMREQPPGTKIVAGKWVPDESDGLSVEEGLAKTLGLKLGDKMQFDVGGVPVSGHVTTLRKVDWGSMRVNFFVMFPRTSMGDLPLSYISAFKAPSTAAPAFDNRLAAQFPNVTAIDVSATIAQVQGVLDQVIHAVELLFAFALVAGLVVLVATVSATREARAREFAVMRAVGASGSLLGRVQQVELLGVGALAGLLAASAAVAVGWGLATWVFEFHWNPPWWVPFAGAASGAALALAAGWWSLHEVLARPVMETLRRAAQE